MQIASRKMLFGTVTLLLLMAAAVLFSMSQPNAQAATAKGDVQIDLMVTGMMPTEVISLIEQIAEPKPGVTVFVINSISDVRISNIGSSGLDGVSISRFIVDSFFDVEYTSSERTSSWQTEMVSMSLTVTFPKGTDVLAAAEKVSILLRNAIQGGGTGDGTTKIQHEYVGHVTVLK